jgi:hypothetical protein
MKSFRSFRLFRLKSFATILMLLCHKNRFYKFQYVIKTSNFDLSETIFRFVMEMKFPKAFLQLSLRIVHEHREIHSNVMQTDFEAFRKNRFGFWIMKLMKQNRIVFFRDFVHLLKRHRKLSTT